MGFTAAQAARLSRCTVSQVRRLAAEVDAEVRAFDEERAAFVERLTDASG